MSEKFSENYKDNESFEDQEGYIFEKFSSKEEMYCRMEEIRKSSPYEANGFIVEKSSQLGFYYRLGDSETTTEVAKNIDNSWHSHPDSDISEILFKKEDLPENIPEKITLLAENIQKSYEKIDEISSKKISLMDIINIVSNGRKKDLISLPDGLLEVDFSKTKENSPIYEYATELSRYSRGLSVKIFEYAAEIVKQSQMPDIQKDLQLRANDFQELRLERMLEYYDFAIAAFEKLLENAGYKKMEKNNFMEILEKIGLPYKFNDREKF